MLVPGGVDRGGTHRVIPCILWQIERLVAAGVELHVFALQQEPEPGRWPLLGAQVHNAGRRPRRARMLAQVVAEHRRAPFDLLHAFWAVPSGMVAAAAGRMLRVPVLLHLPGGDLARLPEIGYGGRLSWRGRLWLRAAVAGASRVVALSAGMIEQARALGIAAGRVPLGIALDRWPSAPPRRRVPGEPACLLHIGSLNRVKDQATLLRTADALRRAGVRFRLDVVGGDTLGGAVQRMAAEMGLDDVVHFHPFVPHHELRTRVDGADLLVITSRHEGGSEVFLEAALAGIPAAGTAVGHLAEWAPDAAAAVPVGDHAALAGEIARLLGDEDARMAMAARAQEHALAEDADFTARELLRHYAELVDGARRPG